MVSLLKYCFGWMPALLYILVGIVFDLFFLAALWKVIQLILELAKMVISVFGGAIAKVASWFL